MNARVILVTLAAGSLFLVMALSFLAGTPWPQTPTPIPVYDPNATAGQGIANAMFDEFAIAIILIALLLGAAMIGGVYLAKMDEPGKVGP